MLRFSSPTDPTAQMFMRQTNTLSRQFWMPTGSSSLKVITTAQITHTYPYTITTFASFFITVTIFGNKTDKVYKSYLLSITLTNKYTNIKQTPVNNMLTKYDHKYNLHSLWGTIAKLSNKKPFMQQNRSIHYKTETAIIDIDKTKQKLLINNSQTLLHRTQTKSIDT